jgi:hypothetical protein
MSSSYQVRTFGRCDGLFHDRSGLGTNHDARRSDRAGHGLDPSHGAIVARELGIPCVANTTNATTTIIDGMTITVDGSAGTVESRPSASNIDDGS